LIKDDSGEVQIKDFSLSSNEQFYVAWYVDIPLVRSRAVEAEIRLNPARLETTLHKEDKVVPGRFILLWKKIYKDKASTAKGSMAWMYINDVFKDGAECEIGVYTTYVVEYEKQDRSTLRPPFELTPEVQRRFVQAINSGELNDYFVQSGDNYLLSQSVNGLPALVERLKGNSGSVC
jgi:hypothetical protein